MKQRTPDTELDMAVADAFEFETKTASDYTGRPLQLPHFSTDYAAVRLVEDAIKRRGLQEVYIQALDKLVVYERSEGWEWFRWALLRATPEQKCRAALAALETP